MSLPDIISEKIRQTGPISFRDFMEIALYYPGLGYYTSPEDRIGRPGDYYTNPNLSQAFGEMLGAQLEEMWHLLGENEFTVVEMGAGTGLLSGDVYGYLKERVGDFNYCIVEKSPALQDKQRKHLGDDIGWYDSLEEIGDIEGCIFSNELVDAFPVHLVQMGKELMEVFVDYDGRFFEILRPASYELKNYMAE
ncbi:MAG TPA: SAM-dependent methyltransferase, partial [Candidatus Methanoperedens sp.]